jgi:molybdopterin-guanine dinucleotide biosynthesis protein A
MGNPKAWLPFGAEFLLPRVARLVQESVEPVVVVAAPEQDLPPVPESVIVVRDAVGGRGPLQGLAAGLRALHGCADAAFVSSCDAPFLKPAFITRLIELLGSSQIAVPEAGGFRHSLAAVYRVDILPVVEELLAANQLKLASLLDRCNTRVVLPDELRDVDPDLSSLRNLNTPEDYEQALRDESLSSSS